MNGARIIILNFIKSQSTVILTTSHSYNHIKKLKNVESLETSDQLSCSFYSI